MCLGSPDSVNGISDHESSKQISDLHQDLLPTVTILTSMRVYSRVPRFIPGHAQPGHAHVLIPIRRGSASVGGRITHHSRTIFSAVLICGAASAASMAV